MKEPPWSRETSADRQPGHWLLASLGKKVLRPGGLELTCDIIEQLRLEPEDDVVEFAPGLGATGRLLIDAHPRSYVGIDRDPDVIFRLNNELNRPGVSFVAASAEQTGLSAESASIVLGEAMLSMQSPEQKKRIGAEAYRLLRRGGRYAIHELALLPDGIDEGIRKTIEREMALTIHVGVRPSTLAEWQQFLLDLGFSPIWQKLSPMHLLEMRRLLSDEGLGGVLKIAANIVSRPDARRRVFAMRRLFQRYASHLSAVALVAVKR